MPKVNEDGSFALEEKKIYIGNMPSQMTGRKTKQKKKIPHTHSQKTRSWNKPTSTSRSHPDYSLEYAVVKLFQPFGKIVSEEFMWNKEPGEHFGKPRNCLCPTTGALPNSNAGACTFHSLRQQAAFVLSNTRRQNKLTRRSRR